MGARDLETAVVCLTGKRRFLFKENRVKADG
jgi:hypothetical protein